jgi:IS5 family transposase
VPRQRNSRDENARIKAGEEPEDWPENKRRQKDVQARWTKKHGKSHYGYKNHISIDRQHKVICKYAVSSAQVHDSQVFEVLLDERNSSADIWADAAYRSTEREAELRQAGYRSHVHRKGTRTASHSAPGRRRRIANVQQSGLGLSMCLLSRLRGWFAPLAWSERR